MTVTAPSAFEIKKYKYIDVLRAFAILGVLMVHASQIVGKLTSLVSAWANYGQAGVQLFFVASGVTLCLSASERRESNPSNFFIRRFFRIAPLYYFGIFFYFAWRTAIASIGAGEFSPSSGYSWTAILQNLVFLHGFSPSNYNSVVPGGWSISVEMTFYLLFPILFDLLGRLKIATLSMLTGAIVLCAFGVEWVLINRMHIAPNNDEFGYVFALIVNQFPVFMVALLTFKMLLRPVSVPVIAIAVGLILSAWYIQNNRSHDTGFDGLVYPFLSAIAFGILTVRLSSMKIPDSRLMRALVHIGQHSFSMYIMHFAVLDLVQWLLEASLFKILPSAEFRLGFTFPVLVGLSYAVARVTGALIEDPGIQFGKQFLLRLRQRRQGLPSSTA